MLNYSTVRTRGSTDPPAVKSDLTVTQRFQTTVSIPTTGSIDVSIADIMAAVPGGSTLWERVRFHHFEVWGTDQPASTASALATASSPIRVTMLNDSNNNFNGDVPTFEDSGTTGQSRAHVSFRPDLFTRLQWNNSGSTSTILRIQMYGVVAATRVVIHSTLQLRAIAPAQPTWSVS